MSSALYFCKDRKFETISEIEYSNFLLTARRLFVFSYKMSASEHHLKITDWEVVARAARFRPASMAAMCSVSLRQLERHFAIQFHTTPKAWTREFRLKLAKKLISHGWSNKAVAAELCFTDNAHFCNEFKAACGTTPRSHGLRTAVPKLTDRVTSSISREERGL